MRARVRRFLLKRGVLLFGGLFSLSSHSASPPSYKISYFERNSEAKPHAILCLTARVNRNPLLFGHSALSTFLIDQKKSPRKKGFVSKKVNWVGLTPFKHPNPGQGPEDAVYLVNNHPADHFLKFQKSKEFPKTARHCVSITAAESKKLNDYLVLHKDDKWRITKNCNDFSTEAFAIATGIRFDARTPLTPLCSMPGTVIKNIKKYQAPLQGAKTFVYKPENDGIVQEPVAGH
jgi:hypothetical protein